MKKIEKSDNMTLIEWTEHYIKYKDSVLKKVEKIEKTSDKSLTVTLKTGKIEKYVCEDELTSFNPSEFSEEKIVCLNKRSNLDWLISNWDHFKDKKLVFLFVNPKKSESWTINTYMHHLVTEKPALKTGLLSLFQSVPEV